MQVWVIPPDLNPVYELLFNISRHKNALPKIKCIYVHFLKYYNVLWENRQLTKKLTKDTNIGKANLTTIGDRIRQLRGNEPRKSLCEKLSVSIRSLINYENNLREPSASLVAKLCEIYNVTTDWLILGKDIELIYSVDQTKQSCIIDHDIEHSLIKNEPSNPSNKKDWVSDLTPDEFEALWDEFREEKEARRGWLQVEVIKRFPEFVEWVAQRPYQPVSPLFAALNKGNPFVKKSSE